MRGVIKAVNASIGRFSVEIASGLTVVEQLDEIDVEAGDIVVGPLEELGRTALRHVTSNETFEVFIQAVGASERQALSMLR